MEFTVNTVALPRPLLNCVLMPKVKEPVRVAATPTKGGSCTIAPLLSAAKKIAG